MKKVVMCIVCLAGFVVSGCAFTPPKRTHAYVTQGVEAIDRNTEANLGIANADPSLDPIKIAMAAETFGEARKSFRAAFDQIRIDIEREEQQRRAILEALASLAIEAIPAGSSALNVAKALGSRIDDAAGDSLKAANDKTAEVKVTADENKKTIGVLKETTQEIANNTKNLENRLGKMEGEIATLKEGKNTIEKDFAVASKRFDSLSDTMKEKLGEVPPSVLLELEKLKGNNAAFRDMFQQKMQFTDEEMKSLEGMSTNELLTMLMLATGAAGAGGVFGKTGKSRSAAEVAKLTDNVNKLEGRVMGRPWENKPNDNPSTL